jgi:hypothetical protein
MINGFMHGPPRDVSAQLKAWRRDRKMSVVEAAERIGIPPRVYRSWEDGVPCRYPALVENAIGFPVARSIRQ